MLFQTVFIGLLLPTVNIIHPDSLRNDLNTRLPYSIATERLIDAFNSLVISTQIINTETIDNLD